MNVLVIYFLFLGVFVTGARDGNIMEWDTRCNRKNGFLNPMNTISHAHAVPVKEAATLSGKKRRSRRTSMFSAVSITMLFQHIL